MNRSKFNKHLGETDRKTRFKLYKSGKNWVRAGLSQIGLLRLLGNNVAEEIDVAEIKTESQSYYSHFAKGIGALSALAGGALYTPNDVQAEELPVGYEMTEES